MATLQNSTQRQLDNFLYRIGQENPKYMNFITAAGIKARVTKPQTLYESLMLVHGARINAYNFYWNMYYNSHWYRRGDDNPSPITVNRVGAMVNKHARFLMNKGFLVESAFFEIERYVQANWRLNYGGEADHNIFGLDLATQGSITGDSWVAYYQAKHPDTGENYTKYEVLQSHKCFPVYDRGMLIGFLYYGDDSAVVDENFGFATYKQVYEGFYLQPGRKTVISSDAVGSVIRYDILDIPVVHVPNMKTVVSPYGISDMLNTSELNKKYNELLTEVQDIIEYHASPVTILTGASASQLIKQANRLWSVPKDAKVSNLELQTDLSATVKHLENIMKAMNEMGNLPTNEPSAISNTSATALAITFMPLYEIMEYKRILYGIGIMKLTTQTIKYAFLTGILSPQEIITNAVTRWNSSFSNYDEETKKKFYPFSNEIDNSTNYDSISTIVDGYLPKELYEVFLTWYPPLPRDEKNTADMAIALNTVKIISKRDARRRIGMTEEASVLMDNEMEEELNNPAYQETVVMSNKTGMENNPDVKGDKESRRRGQKTLT